MVNLSITWRATISFTPLYVVDCVLNDDTRTETRFRLSAKRTSPFKPAGASVQSTTGSRGVRISGSNSGYTMSRGSVKGTGHPLHSPVSPSLPISCVNVCHHISTGLYPLNGKMWAPRTGLVPVEKLKPPSLPGTEHFSLPDGSVVSFAT